MKQFTEFTLRPTPNTVFPLSSLNLPFLPPPLSFPLLRSFRFFTTDIVTENGKKENGQIHTSPFPDSPVTN